MHCSHAVAVCQYPPRDCWDLLRFSHSPFCHISDRVIYLLIPVLPSSVTEDVGSEHLQSEPAEGYREVWHGLTPRRF